MIKRLRIVKKMAPSKVLNHKAAENSSICFESPGEIKQGKLAAVSTGVLGQFPSDSMYLTTFAILHEKFVDTSSIDSQASHSNII